MAETNPDSGQKSPQKSKKTVSSKGTGSKKKAGSRKKAPARKKVAGSQASAKPDTSPPESAAVPVSAQTAQPGTRISDAAALPPQTPDRVNNLSWAAIVISLIALVAGGYAWYQTAVNARIESGEQVNRVDAVEQRIGSFISAQEDFGNQVSQLKGQLGKAEDSFSDQIRNIRSEILDQQAVVKAQVVESEQVLRTQGNEFRQEFQTLSDSIVKLRSELGRSVDSWSLEEVEQLLVIANQRLQLSADTELAGNALKLADSRLQQLSNPALAPIRQLVANEIASLGNVPAVDVAGTLNALSALANSVDNLPLAGDVEDSAVTASGNSSKPSDESDGDSSLMTAGRDFIADLGALVQIERNGQPLTPILSAELRLMIFEKVKLIIESAQLAFLREQGEVYSARLAQAGSWVKENFDTETSQVSTWLEQLAGLAAVSPELELPDISESLQALRGVMQDGA